MDDVPEVRDKLAWLAAHGGEYDTLFLGSSRVRRQISPKIFDERMAARGVPTRSFNLGIDAMTFPELSFVLREILASKPPKLRWVIADVNPLRRKLGPANDRDSLRSVYWHDAAHTAQVCEAIIRDALAGYETPGASLALLAGHCELMLRHYSNMGRGVELLQVRLDPDATRTL
jgi:hypothetical protein